MTDLYAPRHTKVKTRHNTVQVFNQNNRIVTVHRLDYARFTGAPVYTGKHVR